MAKCGKPLLYSSVETKHHQGISAETKIDDNNVTMHDVGYTADFPAKLFQYKAEDVSGLVWSGIMMVDDDASSSSLVPPNVFCVARRC